MSQLFRGAQAPGKAMVSAAVQRPAVFGVAEVVGVADEVGHRCVTQHSSAVGQRRATETQHLSIREIDIDRRRIA